MQRTSLPPTRARILARQAIRDLGLKSRPMPPRDDTPLEGGARRERAFFHAPNGRSPAAAAVGFARVVHDPRVHSSRRSGARRTASSASPRSRWRPPCPMSLRVRDADAARPAWRRGPPSARRMWHRGRKERGKRSVGWRFTTFRQAATLETMFRVDQHRALGLPGRPRGVDDGRQVVGTDLRGGRRCGTRRAPGARAAWPRSNAPANRLNLGSLGSAIHGENGFQRQTGCRLQHLGEQLGARTRPHLRARVLDHHCIESAGRSAWGRSGPVTPAESEGREIGQRPLVAITRRRRRRPDRPSRCRGPSLGRGRDLPRRPCARSAEMELPALRSATHELVGLAIRWRRTPERGRSVVSAAMVPPTGAAPRRRVRGKMNLRRSTAREDGQDQTVARWLR
jgi:hypothetical protein